MTFRYINKEYYYINNYLILNREFRIEKINLFLIETIIYNLKIIRKKFSYIYYKYLDVFNRF